MCAVLYTVFLLLTRKGESVRNGNDWFEVHVEPDGTKYVIKVKEELDKNRSIWTRAHLVFWYVISSEYTT